MANRVAYLAQGQLYLAQAGEKPHLLESHFVQQMLERQEQQRSRNDWKSGMAWNVTGGMRLPRELMGPVGAGARPARFSTVARGPTGELLYGIQSGSVGGLFAYEESTGYERRMLHRADFEPRDLARHPVTGELAISIVHDDGTSSIATMNADGKKMQEVTGGDSVDEAPSWAHAGRTLVYQSAGVARNAQGMRVGQGPYALLQLDLEGGNLKTLLESDTDDFLSPRLMPDGTLYYIRRPYEREPKARPMQIVRDVLLMPFGFILTIVAFFNWLSTVLRQKPLMTSGGPRREEDARYMMLWGTVIDAQKAVREKGGDGIALVPKDWQLIRRSPDHREEVLAKSVISYDLTSDGGVYYTTGGAIHHLSLQGARQDICAGKLIERVISLT